MKAAESSVGWRSTTLNLAAKHCPRALDFYETGAPYDREIFAVGTAAHVVLEEIGKASVAARRWLDADEALEVARVVCVDLIAKGRSFEGAPEPPLPSDAVWQGRVLAMAYHLESPMPHDFRYEIGVAVNRQWELCPYDEGAWLRCRIDAAGTRLPNLLDDFEDDLGGPILEIRDYKSAWNADETELKTLQRKIQAVLGWLAWGEGHDSLRVKVVNFRLRRDFETIVFPNTPEGARVLATWQEDIAAEIHAREAQRGPDGRRPAAPGAVCYGCPYLHQCADAQAYLEPVFCSADPAELAVRYAVLDAALDDLKAPLKAATTNEPIVVAGGLVGTMPSEKRALKPSAPEILGEAWNRRGRAESVDAVRAAIPGLLQALQIGVANAEALLKHMFRGSEDERERRSRLLGQLLTTKIDRRFGVHKEKP